MINPKAMAVLQSAISDIKSAEMDLSYSGGESTMTTEAAGVLRLAAGKLNAIASNLEGYTPTFSPLFRIG